MAGMSAAPAVFVDGEVVASSALPEPVPRVMQIRRLLDRPWQRWDGRQRWDTNSAPAAFGAFAVGIAGCPNQFGVGVMTSGTATALPGAIDPACPGADA